MNILGLSCDYHDAAAAVVIDGEIVAAAEQERFSRLKHDRGLPTHAVASCLAVADLDASAIDAVVFHEKPIVAFGRMLAARQRRGPRSIAAFAREMPTALGTNLMIAHRVGQMFFDLGAERLPPIRFSEHHVSHAAAAFHPSPFDTAAILTVDGLGEWATASVGHGAHHRIDLLEDQRFPHSLGLLYSLVTIWCGFEPNDGEYKVMGLAPFGEPTYLDALQEIAQLDDDGSITVAGGAVRWWGGHVRRSSRLARLFDGPPRLPTEAISQRDRDLARSVQEYTESAMLAMAMHAHELTGESRLCMAGGVALNCVANGRILREGPFEEVWIQPAAGDAGSAIGAALWYWHEGSGEHRERGERDIDAAPLHDAPPRDSMSGAALGPSFSSSEIRSWLERIGVSYRHMPDATERNALVASRLADGDIVGWFEGRMEFGPRSLGHRSILADPRSPTVQADLNIRVKGRESFRPFAPAVLEERAAEWFDLDRTSPYMLFTAQVAASRRVEVAEEPTDLVDRVRVPRSQIPACTHIDGSARVQTVDRHTHTAFHALITSFFDLTGCPVLLNTSFNVGGEPIVCNPEDALATARAAGLDLLVLEDCVIEFAPTATAAMDGAE